MEEEASDADRIRAQGGGGGGGGGPLVDVASTLGIDHLIDGGVGGGVGGARSPRSGSRFSTIRKNTLNTSRTSLTKTSSFLGD